MLGVELLCLDPKAVAMRKRLLMDGEIVVMTTYRQVNPKTGQMEERTGNASRWEVVQAGEGAASGRLQLKPGDTIIPQQGAEVTRVFSVADPELVCLHDWEKILCKVNHVQVEGLACPEDADILRPRPRIVDPKSLVHAQEVVNRIMETKNRK